jgi:hypothetical protein
MDQESESSASDRHPATVPSQWFDVRQEEPPAIAYATREAGPSPQNTYINPLRIE